MKYNNKKKSLTDATITRVTKSLVYGLIIVLHGAPTPLYILVSVVSVILTLAQNGFYYICALLQSYTAPRSLRACTQLL